MPQATKSKKRLNFIETICEGITHEEIFNTIDYKHQSEDKIKQFTYPYIVKTLTEYLVEKGKDKTKAREFVKRQLKWEGNVNTTVHHTLFMGTMNRPDMVLEMEGLKIAIVKVLWVKGIHGISFFQQPLGFYWRQAVDKQGLLGAVSDDIITNIKKAI